MAINNYGDISPRVGVVATKKLLTRGQHMMVLERFGQTDPQGQNRGLVRKYRRYLTLTRATTPLAEGITPSGQKLTFEDVTITLEQYGDIVELTDVIADTHEDPVLNEMMTLVGEQVAETVEELRYNVLKAGTNVFYANGSARTDVDTEVSVVDLRSVFRSFKRNKAREISRIVSATAKIATEPIGSAFFAVGHTDLQPSFQDLTGFTPIEKYSQDTVAFEGEIGKIENIRIILTAFYEPFLLAGGTSAAANTVLANGVPNAAGTEQADVYPILVFARDSYAIVPLQGREAVIPTVQNPNQPRGGDPLGQRGSVGWKTYQATGILNQSWLARIEVAARALV